MRSSWVGVGPKPNDKSLKEKRRGNRSRDTKKKAIGRWQRLEWCVHKPRNVWDYQPPYLGRGFPGGTSGKEPACQCRRCKRCRFDPWVGKIRWKEHGDPLQSCCLENPKDKGAWRAMVHTVAKSQPWLKRFSSSIPGVGSLSEPHSLLVFSRSQCP